MNVSMRNCTNNGNNTTTVTNNNSIILKEDRPPVSTEILLGKNAKLFNDMIANLNRESPNSSTIPLRDETKRVTNSYFAKGMTLSSPLKAPLLETDKPFVKELPTKETLWPMGTKIFERKDDIKLKDLSNAITASQPIVKKPTLDIKKRMQPSPTSSGTMQMQMKEGVKERLKKYENLKIQQTPQGGSRRGDHMEKTGGVGTYGYAGYGISSSAISGKTHDYRK